MIYTKVCGITNVSDAVKAVEAGADALGFNFFSESPRYIELDQARRIINEVPDTIWKVGVFADANPEYVREHAQSLNLDFLQFHGDETPYYCEQFAAPYWKAFRLKDEKTLALMKKYQASAYLVDAYQKGILGGTGLLANWDLALEAKQYGKLVLAGGLRPENVQEAIAIVQPWAVDVCSGVESSPGVKDPDKMFEFVCKVRESP
jgi:phosphoribosylanthranilate isomerase